MSFSANPTTIIVPDVPGWLTTLGVDATAQLGACVNADGTTVSSAYDETSNTVAYSVSAGAAPSTVFQSFTSWAGQPGSPHFGHRLTHIGPIVGPSGVGDAWKCQADNVVCLDTTIS